MKNIRTQHFHLQTQELTQWRLKENRKRKMGANVASPVLLGIKYSHFVEYIDVMLAILFVFNSLENVIFGS